MPAALAAAERAPMLSVADIRAAQARLQAFLPPTPLLRCWVPLPCAAVPPCSLKCENLQPTGSFKIRGALHKVLALSVAQRERGVVAASTGNHGRAVAHALRLTGGRGTVFIPATTPPNKVQLLRDSGVEVCVHGVDCGATERHARCVAAGSDRVYISPYNDAEVVAGQGTAGLEILAQCPEVDVILVAVGGGGLISGIACAAKALKPSVRIVGCWPQHATTMFECMRAGRVVEVPERPTLSDATAGSLEPGAITVAACRDSIDRCVFVSEAEIAHAIRLVWQHHHMVIEGAAGVALAAWRQLGDELAGANAVVVVCGANLALATLQQIVDAEVPPAGVPCSGRLPTD